MEKLSRVKKYEGLRKSIELDNPVDTSQEHVEKTNSISVKNSEFDSSILKRVEIKEQNETIAKRAKIDTSNEKEKNVVEDTFTNEYLDDFIKEVRDYNIRKGNRESDNTQADILYQLNAVNRAKRSCYIQEINEELSEPEKTATPNAKIAAEVQNLIHQEEIEPDALQEQADIETIGEKFEEVIYSKDVQNTTVIPTVKKEITPVYIDYDEETDDGINVEPNEVEQPTVSINTEDLQDNTIMETTKQLRVQVEGHEEELTDLSDGVEKTNIWLNFVLCFLILVLLAIIGFIAYGIWKAGGFR